MPAAAISAISPMRSRTSTRLCDKLARAGVTINRPPRDGHMAFIRTPDGISIELLQKGAALPAARALGQRRPISEAGDGAQKQGRARRLGKRSCRLPRHERQRVQPGRRREYFRAPRRRHADHPERRRLRRPDARHDRRHGVSTPIRPPRREDRPEGVERMAFPPRHLARPPRYRGGGPRPCALRHGPVHAAPADSRPVIT